MDEKESVVSKEAVRLGDVKSFLAYRETMYRGKPCGLIGQDVAVRAIQSRMTELNVEKPTRNCLNIIVGPGGCGKSELIRNFLPNFYKLAKYQVAIIDGSRFEAMTGSFRAELDQCFQRFIKNRELIKSKKHGPRFLLAIDNFERMNEVSRNNMYEIIDRFMVHDLTNKSDPVHMVGGAIFLIGNEPADAGPDESAGEIIKNSWGMKYEILQRFVSQIRFIALTPKNAPAAFGYHLHRSGMWNYVSADACNIILEDYATIADARRLGGRQIQERVRSIEIWFKDHQFADEPPKHVLSEKYAESTESSYHATQDNADKKYPLPERGSLQITALNHVTTPPPQTATPTTTTVKSNDVKHQALNPIESLNEASATQASATPPIALQHDFKCVAQLPNVVETSSLTQIARLTTTEQAPSNENKDAKHRGSEVKKMSSHTKFDSPDLKDVDMNSKTNVTGDKVHAPKLGLKRNTFDGDDDDENDNRAVHKRRKSINTLLKSKDDDDDSYDGDTTESDVESHGLNEKEKGKDDSQRPNTIKPESKSRDMNKKGVRKGVKPTQEVDDKSDKDYEPTNTTKKGKLVKPPNAQNLKKQYWTRLGTKHYEKNETTIGVIKEFSQLMFDAKRGDPKKLIHNEDKALAMVQQPKIKKFIDENYDNLRGKVFDMIMYLNHPDYFRSFPSKRKDPKFHPKIMHHCTWTAIGYKVDQFGKITPLAQPNKRTK